MKLGHAVSFGLLVLVGGCSGGSFTQAEGGGHKDAGSDAAGNGGTGGSAGTSGTGGCAADQKQCDDRCVDKDDPLFGCTQNLCEPCDLPFVASYSCEAGRCKITSCADGQDDCDDEADNGCEANLNSPSTCGDCDMQCPPGDVCDSHNCAAECSRDECNGICVDLQFDPQHCGYCDNACPDGPSDSKPRCVAGSCAFECDPNLSTCFDACVDTFSDPKNCGGCGNRCTEGGPNAVPLCQGGACTFECMAGRKLCDTACVDVRSDVAHCGDCNIQCHPAVNGVASCSNGQCQPGCPDTLRLCGDECVDVRSDVAHCGDCNIQCQRPVNGVASCSGGVCTPSCPAPLLLCENECLDLNNDVDHCLGCNKPCPKKPNETATCSGGQCNYTCDPGFDRCGSAGCTAITNDEKNCGFCGHGCLGSPCVNGYCTPTTYASALGRPTDIAVDPGPSADGQVFWTIENDKYGLGQVLSVPKVGGTIPNAFLSNLTNPSTIAVDNLRIYVGLNGSIGQYLRGSSLPPAPIIITTATPVDISLDDTRLFWADHGKPQVLSAPKGSSSPTTIAALVGLNYPLSPRPDQDSTLNRVYFGTRNAEPTMKSSVFQTKRDMDFVHPLHSQEWPVGQVAVSPTAVFWTEPAAGTVYTMLKSTNTITIVSTKESNAGPIEAHGEFVAWAMGGSGGDQIRALYQHGIQTLAVGQRNVCALAIDQQYVYWINCFLGGEVRRVPR